MWEPISISPFWQVSHLHDDETVVSAPLHLTIRHFPSSALIAVQRFAHADSFEGWDAGNKNLVSSGKFQCFSLQLCPPERNKEKQLYSKWHVSFLVLLQTCMLRGRAQVGATPDLQAYREWERQVCSPDLCADREQESMGICRNDSLVCPLLRLTQDPHSFPWGKLESFIHTTLLEIWDLRINTSSSPASLLTFNMIAKFLFQCCVAQGLVKWWEGQHWLVWAENCKGNPSGPPCLSGNRCSRRMLTPSFSPCNFLLCACVTGRKCRTS